MGLLKTKDNTAFRNNQKTTLKRSEVVKKIFFNDPKFFETFCEKITEYRKCGYAVPAKNDSCIVPERINYIPHHSVSTSSKFKNLE